MAICLATARKARNWALVGNLLDLGIIETLYRQFGATLSAAARDNQAPLVASHADTEAVSVAAFGFFGLIGAFHDLDILTGGR